MTKFGVTTDFQITHLPCDRANFRQHQDDFLTEIDGKIAIDLEKLILICHIDTKKQILIKVFQYEYFNINRKYDTNNTKQQSQAPTGV